MPHLRLLICIILLLATAAPAVTSAMAAPPKTTTTKGKKSTQAKTSQGTKGTKAKGGKSKTSQPAAKKGKSRKQKAKKETSAGVQRQQQSVNREIEETRRRIEANDVAVSTNLATLQALDHDVQVQTGRVNTLRTRATSLRNEVAACSASIAQSEQRLADMRSRYVQLVKRMRASKKRSNSLAFVFASKNFYQAMRRMRYVRKVADARRKREEQIRAEIASLEQQRERLTAAQTSLQSTLTEQEEASRLLALKQTQQRQTVATLRANGEALRTHLQQKQAEANTLNARVAQLIAQEQAEAERQRQEQARLEAQRQEQARLEAQRRAEQQAAEQARREQELAQAQAQAQVQATPPPATPKKEKKQKTKPAKDKTPKQQTPAGGKDDKRYASARRRQPRSDNASPGQGQNQAQAPASNAPAQRPAAAGFASAKGSLPRPVAGSFSIVSRFGKHPLPDLPEVMYDNPGIDAVVSAGASAQAVYAGTVSGVYALPGYNTVVIISHGEYYTVYGNIGTPAVKKGDKVRAGQALGRLVADPGEGGRTTIHFEVWQNRVKQNPEAWIR